MGEGQRERESVCLTQKKRDGVRVMVRGRGRGTLRDRTDMCACLYLYV